MCVVPNVKGMTLAAAERRIKSQDCSIGRITRDASRTVREQHVIAQKPKAGAQLKYQAKVNLLVSKGGH
jgi:beta-lactam-binding protein with PASTA domain